MNISKKRLSMIKKCILKKFCKFKNFIENDELLK